MQLEKKSFETVYELKSVKGYINPYTSETNKAMRGFVSVDVYEGETLMWRLTGLNVIETKEGKVFIAEPQGKAFTDKEGNITSKPIFIAPKELKELILKQL